MSHFLPQTNWKNVLAVVAMVISQGGNSCSLSWSGIGHNLDLHPGGSANDGSFAYNINVHIHTYTYVRFLSIQDLHIISSTCICIYLKSKNDKCSRTSACLFVCFETLL